MKYLLFVPIISVLLLSCANVDHAEPKVIELRGDLYFSWMNLSSLYSKDSTDKGLTEYRRIIDSIGYEKLMESDEFTARQMMNLESRGLTYLPSIELYLGPDSIAVVYLDSSWYEPLGQFQCNELQEKKKKVEVRVWAEHLWENNYRAQAAPAYRVVDTSSVEHLCEDIRGQIRFSEDKMGEQEQGRMITLLKTLPKKLVFNLDGRQLDTLVQNREYTLPGGDSLYTEICHLSSDTNYWRLTFSYTTGQRGFSQVELRLFETESGDEIVVYSKYGGAAIFEQQELKVFDYQRGKLIPLVGNDLPKSLSPKSYFLPQTPDSLIEKFSRELNTSFSMDPGVTEGLRYSVSCVLIESEYDSWIRTEHIDYRWDGVKFERVEMTQKTN